jgi:long-chain acyl-CoA synthetase
VSDLPKTLPLVLARNVREMPDELAMRRKDLGRWQAWTWREVGAEVVAIARRLREAGVKRGDRIALLGDNEPDLFWAEWAAQCLGCAVVCLFSDTTASEASYVLEHSACSVAVVEDQEQVDKILEVERNLPELRRILYWDPKGLHGYSHPRLESLRGSKPVDGTESTLSELEEMASSTSPDDVAAIIYTSGTTGQPKAIVASHLTILDCAMRYAEVLLTHPHVNYLSYISPAWATEQYLGMTLGLVIPFILNFPEEPDTFTEDLREIGPEIVFLSPRQWEMIVSQIRAKIQDGPRAAEWMYDAALAIARSCAALELGPRRAMMSPLRALAELLVLRPLKDRIGLSRVKAAMNSGGALSPDAFEFFNVIGVKIQNLYGFTEAGIVTATRRDDRRFDSVGTILHTTWGAEPIQVGISEDGEIRVRGGIAFLGYMDDQAATASRFDKDGWILSGDAGYFDDAGHLIYLDRANHRRRLRDGSVFYPQFIETRLRMSPYIRDVVILGDVTRDWIGALIDIDLENAGRWAERKGISYSTYTDLSQMPEVRQLIATELTAFNARMPEGSRIHAFANLYKPLDPDEGELTRSRKLRREHVEASYAELIDALYAEKQDFETETEVRFRDGRLGKVRAHVSTEVLRA